MLQRNIDFTAVLVVEYRVTMAERAPLRILATQADWNAIGEY